MGSLFEQSVTLYFASLNAVPVLMKRLSGSSISSEVLCIDFSDTFPPSKVKLGKYDTFYGIICINFDISK